MFPMIQPESGIINKPFNFVLVFLPFLLLVHDQVGLEEMALSPLVSNPFWDRVTPKLCERPQSSAAHPIQWKNKIIRVL